MVMCATYTPAPRGRRVRGTIYCLRPGPGGEARARYCMLPTPQPREGGVCVVLYATYTPAPTGREGGVCVD